MQMARDDAEPVVLPGRRDGAAWPPAVDLRGVHKSFGLVQAVRGVVLAVGSGEVMAFLGPNGAGKTSTIDMILGLSRPKVLLVDRDPQRRAEIGRSPAGRLQVHACAVPGDEQRLRHD
jgi:ABC-2 type transport system ATP-binding protein